MIKNIRKERFEAVSYGRGHFIHSIAEEIEWFSNEEETVLGIVLYDLIDFDFSFVVLGRDEAGVFRAIDFKTSFETKELARESLHDKIKFHGINGDTEFPQGDKKTEKQRLLHPIVNPEKLHNHFKTLTLREGYSCARELITEVAYAFTDPDGNYIQQFQTTGFNSRLWEIFLYAFFHEEKFNINRDHVAPDFHLEKNGQSIFVEAVTANPGQNMPPPPKTPEEILELLKNFIPIRFSSSLCSKLNRENKLKYWELDHVKNKPFIFAIHDYTYDNSMTWTRTALETYLYGYRHDASKDSQGNVQVKALKIENHTWEGKIISSGFFFLPNSEYVSAVLFTNTGTLTTFNRMGFLAEFGGANIKMVRSGTSYNQKTGKIDKFKKEVIKDKYKESWGEGLMMYHNPNALFPLNSDFFPNIAHMTQKDGEWIGRFPDFYPLDTVTSIEVLKTE